MDGTVIDVQVFTRDGVEKDQRALQIEEEQLEHVRKDLNDQLRIMEDDIYQRVVGGHAIPNADQNSGMTRRKIRTPMTPMMIPVLAISAVLMSPEL